MEKSNHGAKFTVRANPVLHEAGDFAGKLDYVRFTADRGEKTHKEWRVDSALLDAALHALDSSGIRYEVLNRLRSGGRVELPGAYSAIDLEKLGFRTAQ
jgi:hypothetical protein